MEKTRFQAFSSRSRWVPHAGVSGLRADVLWLVGPACEHGRDAAEQLDAGDQGLLERTTWKRAERSF